MWKEKEDREATGINKLMCGIKKIANFCDYLYCFNAFQCGHYQSTVKGLWAVGGLKKVEMI